VRKERLEDIANKKVGKVVQAFVDAGAEKVTATQVGEDEWTVEAVFNP
jgi:hypothetical protein